MVYETSNQSAFEDVMTKEKSQFPLAYRIGENQFKMLTEAKSVLICQALTLQRR